MTQPKNDFVLPRDEYDFVLEIDDTDDFQTEIRTLVRERSPRPMELAL